MKKLCVLAAGNEIQSYLNVIEALEDRDYYTNDRLNERFRRKSVVAHAAESGYLDTLIYLIKNFNIDLSTRETEFSLLFWAAKHTSLDTFSYLINPENGLLDQIDDNTTPLHIAAYKGDINEVKRLIALDPACIHQLDKNHHSALFYAALNQDTQLVTYLRQTIETSDVSADLLDRQHDSLHRGYGHALWRRVRNLDNSMVSAYNEELDLYQQSLDHFKKIKHVCESDYEYLVKSCERIVAHYMHSYKYELALPFIELIEHYFKEIKLFRAEDESYTTYEAEVLDDLRVYQKRVNGDTASDESNGESDAEDDDLNDLDTPESYHNPELEKLRQTLARAQQIASDYGLQCINVEGDGNCFFHVIFQHLSSFGLNAWPNAQAIRLKAIRHINVYSSLYLPFFQEEDGGLDSYIIRASESTYWADEYLISATSRALRLNLVIFSTHTPIPQVMKQQDAIATIYLMNLENQHFQTLCVYSAIEPKFAIQPMIEAATCDDEFRSTRLGSLIEALEDAESTDVTPKRAFGFFNDDSPVIKKMRLREPDSGQNYLNFT